MSVRLPTHVVSNYMKKIKKNFLWAGHPCRYYKIQHPNLQVMKNKTTDRQTARRANSLTPYMGVCGFLFRAGLPSGGGGVENDINTWGPLIMLASFAAVTY